MAAHQTQGPYSGVKFMVYDGLKEWWARDIGPWERLGFGSIAGIAATISTYPRMAVLDCL
jgi:hypothetical protein